MRGEARRSPLAPSTANPAARLATVAASVVAIAIILGLGVHPVTETLPTSRRLPAGQPVAGSSVVGAPPAQTFDPAELVALGNALYEEGDFADAIEAYRAILDRGFENGGLHYNLGNAHFKNGELGWAILAWERAAKLMPGDDDVEANLELARALTRDEIQPLPRFWLFAATERWLDLLPMRWLALVVGTGWLAVTGGISYLLLTRGRGGARPFVWTGGLLLLLFGPGFVVHQIGWGGAERAVILEERVPVRSAPAGNDDLTLFYVHEGTSARIDARTDFWVEVVLDDGKVGWVPAESLEKI